jgi:hypothetical protein
MFRYILYVLVIVIIAGAIASVGYNCFVKVSSALEQSNEKVELILEK